MTNLEADAGRVIAKLQAELAAALTRALVAETVLEQHLAAAAAEQPA